MLSKRLESGIGHTTWRIIESPQPSLSAVSRLLEERHSFTFVFQIVVEVVENDGSDDTPDEETRFFDRELSHVNQNPRENNQNRSPHKEVAIAFPVMTQTTLIVEMTDSIPVV